MIITKPIGKDYKKYLDKDGYIDIEVELDIDDIIECGGIEGFNNILEEKILGEGVGTLSDIGYSVSGHKTGEGFCCGGTVIIKVHAEVVTIFDE